MNFYIVNLGCKVNACEAESISEALIAKGWKRSEVEDDSDVVLIFTCAVTNTAAAKSRQQLHKAKHKSHQPITVVIGCYTQLKDGLLNDADILVGSHHKEEIPSLLDQFMQNHQQIIYIDDLSGTPFELLPLNHFENHSRAVLKIQDGCNQFCSYCIIPYVRGRERSLDPAIVIQQAKDIARNYSEIVLTGIHTGRYGREYSTSLTELMKQIIYEVPSLQRLRISSIEVTEVSDDLVQFMKEEPKIAHHLHIPLQSGCDEILQRMNRPYDTATYYDKIMSIRQEIGNVAISCDVIVGFPAETDEMFQQTYDFIQKCQFSFLHVFPYSPREGTPAAAMKNQVPPEIKKKRVEMLRNLSQELSDSYQSKQVGKEAIVITEMPIGDDTPGHTSDYIAVRIPQEKYARGTKVHVHLKAYHNHQMIAETESVNQDEII